MNFWLSPVGDAEIDRVEVRREGLTGPRVHATGGQFGPLVLRIAGWQWNDLDLQLVDGWSAAVASPQPGDGLVAAEYQETTSGSGKVRCCMKTLLTLGHGTSDASSLTARVGQAFEFVPLLDPRRLLVGDPMLLRLRSELVSVADCPVLMEYRSPGAKAGELSSHSTRSDGCLDIPSRGPGEYLLTAKRQDADHTDVVATLHFVIGGGQ